MLKEQVELFRKVSRTLWTCILLSMIISMPVLAKSQDGMEVTLSTDKTIYQEGDQIIITTSVVNTNDSISAKNVKMVNHTPEGFRLVEGSSAENIIASLVPKESASITSIYEKVTKITATTAINTGTTRGITNTEVPNTGDDRFTFLWTGILILSMVSVILVIKHRSGKKSSSTYNMWIIGIVVVGACAGMTSLSVKAEETNVGIISVEESVKFGNETVELKATVNYSIDRYTSDRYIPSEDADVYINDNLYSDYAGDEHIKFDKNTGITYFDNELLVFFEGDLEEAIAKLSKELSMTIVGKNSYDNSCLIRFDHAKEHQDLVQICDTLNEKDYVKNAYLNYYFEKNPQYYPNDSKWSNLWEDVANGENWGMEAIFAPKVWDYKDKMTTINVGVYDVGFDIAHRDLRNVATTLSAGNEEPDDVDHGTHVAGTIGAEFDNGYGVAGVFPKANLATISCRINVSSDIDKLAYSYLIAEKNCKVVNESLGIDLLCFAASQGEVAAQEQLKASAAVLAESLSALDKNFVICTAAGNTSGEGYQFVKSTDADYGYYRIEKNNNETGYFDNEGKWNKYSGSTISAPCDAVWSNNITCISSESLKNKIIVVGASQLNKNSSYSLARFSNKGDRVDVIAPGMEIESTKSSVEFGNLDGTSMASPHVAGLAGMLYSINPYVTGEQIKAVIVETATTIVSGADGKNMINAFDAYNRFEGLYSQTGKISGKVVDEQGNPISEAFITMVDSSLNGIPFGSTTKENGEFIVDSEIGTHTFEVKKDGFETYQGTATVDAHKTTIIFENIVLKKNEENTISGTVYSDADKLPLANVEIKGYKSGSQAPISLGTSGTNGKYSFVLESDIAKLEFSLSGFKTKEIVDFLLFDGNVYLEADQGNQGEQGGETFDLRGKTFSGTYSGRVCSLKFYSYQYNDIQNTCLELNDGGNVTYIYFNYDSLWDSNTNTLNAYTSAVKGYWSNSAPLTVKCQWINDQLSVNISLSNGMSICNGRYSLVTS